MEIAREMEGGEFWLPSEFLADDFLLGERKGKGGGAVFGLSPELAAEKSDEDYLAGLTRQMKHLFLLGDEKGVAPFMAAGNPKARAMAAASPESTLYAMELLAASRKESPLIPARKPSRPSSATTKCHTAGYYAKPALAQRQLQAARFHYLRQQQQQLSVTLLGKQSRVRGDRQVGLSPSAWPPGSGMRAVFLTGGGTKRESAGTGVFLPRTPGSATEPRKKPGCSTVLLPARVVQALNLNLDELRAQPHYPGGFVLDHDALVGRSNVHRHLRPQPQPVATANEIHLPHEWTY